MSKGKVTVVSLALHRSSGGPTKTIACFKDALHAELYSFFDAKKIQLDPVGVDGANIVKVCNIPIAKQFMWASRRALLQAEESFSQSSIVSCHSFYRYHALWVSHMSRKYGVPYWFVPHGILDPWVMDKGRCVKQLYWKTGGRAFLENASTVVFSTSAERDKAKSQFDLPESEVIPWPVALVDCSDQVRRRNQIREELKIPHEAKVLIYFGRLHTMKKPLETIRAVASGGDDNLHLLIVGNEQDVSLKDCFRVAEELGVNERVHLVGPVYGKKKYDYLLAADAYISLSFRENFNHTAAESLSAGLPLILSPGNDLQGDIASEHCSWGLSDNEPKTASDAIEAFNSLSFEELAEMGNRGRDWVGRNLEFSKFAERIQSVANQYGKIR
jgi:glycosyltransferase involved in cell wall biosynthesis